MTEQLPECPVCSGTGNAMGQLGRLCWYRCRDCGSDFNCQDSPCLEATPSLAADQDHDTTEA